MSFRQWPLVARGLVIAVCGLFLAGGGCASALMLEDSPLPALMYVGGAVFVIGVLAMPVGALMFVLGAIKAMFNINPDDQK